MSVQTLIQIRRGLSTEWTAVNPVLSAGEWGYETNTGRYKIGDGITGWTSLDYSAITPDSFVQGTGIGLTQGANGSTLTIAVTGITSSLVTDFNSAVSGIVTSISVSPEEILDIVGTGLVGASGIGIDYQDNSDQIAISVTGIESSQINDFNSAVSGLLPSVAGGSGISVDFSSNTYTVSLSDPTIQASDITDFVDAVNDRVDSLLSAGSNIGLTYVDNGDETSSLTIDVTGVALSGHTHTSSDITDFDSAVSAIVATGALSASEVMDIVGTGIVEGSNIDLTYNAGLGTLTIDVTGVSLVGHTHTSSEITDFDSSVSGLLPVTELSEGTGIGISNVGTDFTISVTGIPSSLVTDFSSAVSDVVDTTLVAGTGINLVYNSGTNELTLSASGVSFDGHSHVLSDITDVSASATEVNYLDGSIPGTGVAGKAVVLDSNLSINNIGNITTTGTLTVGGDLVVQGTTTTVNSTTVDIGDNIIRVNTSGLTTGGFEVYTGTDYKQLIWNVSNNRWEFTGGNIYTTGNFIGDLTGNADTVTSGVYTYQTGTVTSTMILDGTIVDADINNSANIDVKKLASGTTGQVLQVSATGIIWGGIDGGTP